MGALREREREREKKKRYEISWIAYLKSSMISLKGKNKRLISFALMRTSPQ